MAEEKSLWRPKEIIVHDKVKDDPATQYFLFQCPDVPVKYISNGNPNNVQQASDILRNAGTSILEQVLAGKQVVFIAPSATDQVDEFIIDDPRMLCPCFQRLKLAQNGCYYKCDWCYLKLTYRGLFPYITVKVQYDKIKKQILKAVAKRSAPTIFSSGELADAISLDHLTGANRVFIPWFGQIENAYLYMLSKSDNVKGLLNLDHNRHTIAAWSINNAAVAARYEKEAPSTKLRLNAAAEVQQKGYRVRIRLDPIVPIKGWQDAYAETVRQIFEKVSPESITIGTLRFEEGFYKQRKTIFSRPELSSYLDGMVPMFEPFIYPGDKKPKVGKYTFPDKQRLEIFRHVIGEIRKHSDCPIALCKESMEIWKATGLDAGKCSCACQFEPVDMVKQEAEALAKAELEVKKIEQKIREDKARDALKMKQSEQKTRENEIDLIDGHTKILFIAPHGHHLDDENTGPLTRLVAEQNGCYAIINEIYGRKAKGVYRKNLNDLSDVKAHLQNKFLNPLLKYKNKIVQEHGSALVFWIHGAQKSSFFDDLRGKTDVDPEEIKVLIGYGQDADEKQQRHTANTGTVQKLIERLNQVGLKAILANETIRQKNIGKKDEDKQKSFCAWDRHNMNQLFRVDETIEETQAYQDPRIQSFQLEFRKLGCRDTERNIQDTAQKLINAISSLMAPVIEPEIVEDEPVKDIVTLDTVDDEKVEKAYNHLKSIFVKHFQNAMLECGQYLVKTFYDGDYDLAQEKKFTGNKSLSKLINRIQQDASEKGDAPSRTWLYDAVNLAIDNDLYEHKKLPSVYGQLGHSHKVNLTSAPNEDVKKALVEETVRERYSVAKLRERIREEKNKSNPDHIPLEELKSELSMDDLEKFSSERLELFKAKSNDQIKETNRLLRLYERNLEKVEATLQNRKTILAPKEKQAQIGREQIDI